MKAHRIAAIDIGSNSIKLVIVETAVNGSDGNPFTIIFQERERVRLGQETLSKKLLSTEAIARSTKSIAKFRRIADKIGVDAILAVATASVREAANADDFVRKVEAETGVNVKILSSVEEAQLIGIAAVQSFGLNQGRLLNVDIGGGSTELSLMRPDGAAVKLFSMKLGAVGLTEAFLSSDPPSEKEISDLRREISLALEQPARELKDEKWQITSGTSGTIFNLAALLNFKPGEAGQISYHSLVALNKMLVEMPIKTRAKMPNISLQRAEVIIAGGQILEGVMHALDISIVQSCSFALREGVIIDFLRKLNTETPSPK